MTIKINTHCIEFPDTGGSFPINTGVSVAANMREALRSAESGAQSSESKTEKAEVFIDTPMVIVPEEQLQYEDAEALYRLTISTKDEESVAVIQKPLHGLNVVALYAVSKDLQTVIEDNFKEHEFIQVALPYLAQSAESRVQGKTLHRTLWAYFHDKSMHVYTFDSQERLLFFNSFNANTPADNAYLLLGVWKHLNLNQMKDALKLLGNVPEKDALIEILRDFIQNICE